LVRRGQASVAAVLVLYLCLPAPAQFISAAWLAASLGTRPQQGFSASNSEPAPSFAETAGKSPDGLSGSLKVAVLSEPGPEAGAEKGLAVLRGTDPDVPQPLRSSGLTSRAPPSLFQI
jgi:hypothetical protein